LQLGPVAITLIPAVSLSKTGPYRAIHFPLWPEMVLAPFYGPFYPIPSPDTGLPTLVDLPTGNRHLQKAPHPSVTDHVTLHVTSFRGNGALWDTYAVQPYQSSEGTQRRSGILFGNFPLIAKLTSVTSFPKDLSALDADQYEREGLTAGEARRGIANEILLYTSRLAAIQGKVAPRFLGLAGAIQNGHEAWCAIFEDAGRELADGEKLLPPIKWILLTCQSGSRPADRSDSDNLSYCSTPLYMALAFFTKMSLGVTSCSGATKSASSISSVHASGETTRMTTNGPRGAMARCLL